MAVLRGVVDPELGSDIVDLGMAKDVAVGDDGTLYFTDVKNHCVRAIDPVPGCSKPRPTAAKCPGRMR